MRGFGAALSLALILFGMGTASAATVPGTVPGSFGVSETGAATYSIPIAVPPGTAGMEPKLSLNYSSQGGNGIAGVGWSLGGLSAITRCPQTIVHDGQTRGVQLDANDRFCLDGQRLILAAGASYGSVGAEYRTEIESFSKIVSIGGTTGDPQYFKVWTKAGQIIEFGNTADARAEAQGKIVAVAWAANKISDTIGNYITFTYFEDSADGEHRVIKIDYTGNGSVAPYNAVEFLYEPRPDPISGYLAGSRVQALQRLANIQAKANGVLLMDFQLDFEIGTTTGRSRLVGLRQCAGSGDCLNPTTFGWQEGEAAAFDPVAVETTAPTGTVNDTWFAMGNLNADGKTDILISKMGSSSVNYIPYFANFNDGSAYTAGSETISTADTSAGPDFMRLFLVDRDGDGLDDVVKCGVATGTNYSYTKWWINDRSNLGGQIDSAARWFFIGYDYNTSWQSWNTKWCQGGDLNADGRGDIVPYLSNVESQYTPWKNYLYFLTTTDNLNFLNSSLTPVPDSTSTSQSYFGIQDVTGDGQADAIRYDYASGLLRNWLSNGTGFISPVSTSIDAGGSPSDRWFTVADVNGDGLGDMVLHTPADGKLKVWLSEGKGTFTAKSETVGFSSSGMPSNTWLLMADVNSDGRADAVKYTPSSGNIIFALSNGNGTFGLPITSTIATGFNPTPTIGPSPTSAWFQPADVNGDGLLDWVIYHPGEGKIKVNLGSGVVPDLLLTITDGHGASRSIVYKPLTEPAVYTKGTGATYPEQDVQAAMYVVSETAADDGTGGQFRNTYRYAGARTHLTGRGFLGFKVLEQTDLQTGIVTRSEYNQTFPNIGTPLLITKTTAGGVELARTENTPASKSLNAGKTYFPYVAYSKEQGKDLNAVILPSTETWNTFDDWGNLTQTISQTSDGFKKQTDNTYTNDATKWFLGRLTRASVASTINNSWTLTRVSVFEYDTTTGLLNKETIEPDAANVQFRLDTTYTFDAFGNRKTVTISSPATGTAAIVTRTTTTTYDARGQFPVAVANALGHPESKTFDSRFGVVANLTGPNALATSWQYDSFGRKTRETRADGTYTVWTYAACDAACPTWGVYRIVTQVYAADGTQAAPASVMYFDKLNRETRTATQGFDGRWIYKDTVYDPRGNVDKLSRPYYADDPVYWIDHTHDDLNRLVQVIEPDNLTKPAFVVDYDGLTVTRTNRKGQITVETRNSQGQKVSVTDAMGNVTGHSYDPFGNLTGTTDPMGNQIVNLYDIRGRKTQTTDPDLGLWTYEYDALGELVKQTDAKQQATTFTYDQLGRMTQRVEPGMTSDWKYDDAAYGKGKLYQAKTNLGYIRTHWYDDKGRPQLTQSNQGAGNPLFMSAVVYDSAGRVSEEYVLSGVPLKRVYNALGYQTETRNASSNALYWQLNQMDAEGHATQETYGNGTVVYTAYLPANGRFNYRIDNRNGFLVDAHTQGYDELGNVAGHFQLSGYASETYTYDALNRLTQMDGIIDNTPNTQTIAYDVYGNITSKTGVGDYAYGGSPSCATGSGAGPHAVCKAGNNAYAYDPNGNLTAGGGRIVGWTAWNMPGGLIQGGQTTTWQYGPERDRYKMTAPGRTTWYQNPSVHQGGHYEYTQYAGGTYEYRTTLYGAGRPIGEVLAINDSGTFTEQTRYFHSDAQGSITAVTDANGAVLTRYRYDPWGKQTLVSGSNTGISQTRQGHTGHEMLDGGLTHMNGRLYDPLISRFVSADPYVQDPYNLQSLNRYSYVWNNPLGYTDPTGYFRLFGKKWSDLRDNVVKPVAAIAAAWVIGPVAYNFGYWGAAGAVGAAVGGFVGSVAGGALAGAATGAVAGGLYGGWNGAVQGAKYGAIGGAIAGPVGELYGNKPWGVERLAANSLAGGATSAAQGGSFADGVRNSFATGSAAWLYTNTVYADTAGRAANPMPGRVNPDGTIYEPNFSDGRIPENILANNFDIVGQNKALSITGNGWTDFWTNLDKQGGFIGRTLNYIPGINATGVLHDTWWNSVSGQPGSMFGFGFNAGTNWGTMLPAAAVTYGTLLNSPYAGQAVILDRIRK